MVYFGCSVGEPDARSDRVFRLSDKHRPVRPIMAQSPNSPKYGPGNMSATLEGTDLVIRVDTTHVVKPRGETMPDNRKGAAEGATKLRPTNLIASSGGFIGVGAVRVSLNVTG